MNYIRLPIGGPSGQRQVTIDAWPDKCPQCHAFGEQRLAFTQPIFAKGDEIEASMWLLMQCQRLQCRRPFFAVYKPPDPLARDAPDYRLAFVTPGGPLPQQRDENIVALSDQFYQILDQAIAAEFFNLDLVAGMGYRKALEFLAKDYAVAELRSRLKDATKAADAVKVAELTSEIEARLDLPLAKVISLIPHDLTKQAAARAAWLGNDETHYTRIWTHHDIDHLKKLLGIVMQFISNEASAKQLVAEMDPKNPP